MNGVRAYMMVLSIAASSYAVGGQSPSPTVSNSRALIECASIVGDVERLACFDRVAKAAGATKSEVAPQIQGRGRWDVSVKTDPFDDSKTVTLILVETGRKAGTRDQAGLVIRCKSNETDMYIVWNDYLGLERTRVTMRWDKEDAESWNWSVSSDHKATFFPGSPVQYLQKRLDASKLFAQVTPYSENPRVAEFNVSGLRQAIQPLREVCGW